MAVSPTSKALKWLRESGLHPGVVEHWNAFARKRVDLWGFIDIIAIRDGDPIRYIQVTSWTNVNARIQKILTTQGDKKDPDRKKAFEILGKHRCAHVEVWGFQSGRVPKDHVNLKVVRLDIDRDGKTNKTISKWNSRAAKL